jgi:hypothetical protein
VLYRVQLVVPKSASRGGRQLRVRGDGRGVWRGSWGEGEEE